MNLSVFIIMIQKQKCLRMAKITLKKVVIHFDIEHNGKIHKGGKEIRWINENYLTWNRKKEKQHD